MRTSQSKVARHRVCQNLFRMSMLVMSLTASARGESLKRPLSQPFFAISQFSLRFSTKSGKDWFITSLMMILTETLSASCWIQNCHTRSLERSTKTATSFHCLRKTISWLPTKSTFSRIIEFQTHLKWSVRLTRKCSRWKKFNNLETLLISTKSEKISKWRQVTQKMRL